MTTILQAALEYAKFGWKVFPCGTDKKPLVEGGFKAGTTNSKAITEMFSRFANPTIGIRTGRESNLVVLDVDKRSGGIETLHRLEEQHGAIETRKAQTGGGGFHYYFEYPQNGQVKSGAGKGGEGIDVKAEGGYVIAPPSSHSSGGTYQWLNGDGVAELPEWLLKKLRSGSGSGSGSAKRLKKGDKKKVSEGARNDALFHYLVKQAYRGLTVEELYALGVVENQKYDPPMDDKEVRGRAKSTWDYAQTHKDNLEDNQAFVADFCIEKFAGGIVHCRETDKWMYWNEERWVTAGAYNYVKRKIIEVIRSFVAQSQDVPDGRTQHVVAWANKVLNDFPIDRILSLISINTAIERSLVQFDSNPYLLNCKNGTVDLKTGKLRPHSPADLITKLCPVKFKSGARCGVWTKFTSLSPSQLKVGWLPLTEILSDFLLHANIFFLIQVL